MSKFKYTHNGYERILTPSGYRDAEFTPDGDVKVYDPHTDSMVTSMEGGGFPYTLDGDKRLRTKNGWEDPKPNHKYNPTTGEQVEVKLKWTDVW